MPRKPREIWEKGTPLNQAWLELSEVNIHPSFQYKRKYAALQKSALLGKFKNKAETVYEDFEPKDPEDRLQHLNKLRYGLMNKLLAELEYETLFAYGFMIHPRIATEPQQIPGAFFIQTRKSLESVMWEEGIYNGVSAHFKEVRVVLPSDVETTPIRPRGRPLKITRIEAAVAEVAKSDPRFASITVKEARPKVATILKNTHKIPSDEANDFSDETLRRALKRVRSKSKSTKI